MNKIFKIAAFALAGTLAFAACQQAPELKLTDVGPETTVNSCTESTYMGADIKFSVTINDKDFALSTLKAKLLYDETEVNNITIRTKDNGATYEGAIQAPLYKDIPNGIATLIFASQNVGMGITYDTTYVALKRPDFATVTLQTEEGASYELAKVADYQYEITQDFPEKVKGVIVTPAINAEGDVITIGWDGSALSASKTASIPFTAGVAGKYTISVNLLTLQASPLGATNVSAVYELKQGQVMDFGGMVDLNNWTVDYDFFVVNDDFTEVTFRAVDGTYLVTYDAKNLYVKAEPVDADGNPGTLSNDGVGTPWVIGSNFGKPVIGPSWNTEDGAYPMARIADKVYQFTMTTPGQMAVSGADFKIFHQKGWGGEFLTENYSELNIAPAFYMDPSSGNIKGDAIEGGKSYKLILDLTDGVGAAKLSYEEVYIPVNLLDIKVNGVAAMKLSNEVYKVMAVNVEQNSILSFSGIDNPLAWYVDPDHFELTADGLKFKAVSGYYSFELNLPGQFVTVRRVKEDGKAATFADEGAITFMGWGVAHPVMTSQLAWDSGALITLAEVEDGVYQFTGIAVEESDGETIGGRWRYDYLSFKFFGQAGWGDEYGTVTLTPEAQKVLAVPGNIELAEGATLELGATYVMTVRPGALKYGKFDVEVDMKKL